MVYENRVLRRITGPKRDEVAGEWRKLHNEELLTQYCSGDQVEKIETGGRRSTYEREERCIQRFVGETCGKETTWKTQA